jgi:hypothetical protein
MAVTKRTRFEVLKRDNHTCRYCGGVAPDAILTVDHVLPISLGGSDDPTNLVAACRDCNMGKASTSPTEEVVADVKQSDLTHAMAMIRAGEIRMAERAKLMAFLSLFLDSWHVSVPNDWENSVGQLYAAGLLEDDLLDASHIAQVARGVFDTRFTYFCGVAWRRVRQTQEIAKALIEADRQDVDGTH